MVKRIDIGEHYLVGIFDRVEPIERFRKVERVRNLSLAERSAFICEMQCLEWARAEIRAKYPTPKHLTFPELFEQAEKSELPLEEKPAYILDIGNHNTNDISGVIVDIGNHNANDISGAIVDINGLE